MNRRATIGPPVLALALLPMLGSGLDGPLPQRFQPRPPQCDPVSERNRVPVGARIDTGEYTLTLVATTGPSQGALARGSLWLLSTAAARDSAVAAGSSHPVPETPRVPLYGATDVDLGGVSAPASGETVAGSPGAHSFDPWRPGVVVWQDADSAGVTARWRLFIGTVRNDRQSCDRGSACGDRPLTDGPGIRLDVHKVEPSGFAGVWRAAAKSMVTGYFCAAPVRYYSRFKTRNLAKPPSPH